MSRIAETFAALRSRGEKGLVAYVAAGDPSLEESRQIVHALVEAGVDLIELGLPFSDPLADGPVIQAGTQRALAAGANTDNVLELIATLRREGVAVPLLIMTYYNLLNRPGVDTFCRRAKAAGVDGLIIPDVPMEEGEELLAATREHGLDLVQFVAPTSTPDRVERAGKLASGFVYVVSLTGVTGQRDSLPERMADLVRSVKAVTETPVAVGFGISRPEHVRQVVAVADAAIVGSAFVKLCGEEIPLPEKLAKIKGFAAELKAATR
ncbi:MAG: tryptophan synthase subunit alpha [Bacillota bacterium]